MSSTVVITRLYPLRIGIQFQVIRSPHAQNPDAVITRFTQSRNSQLAKSCDVTRYWSKLCALMRIPHVVTHRYDPAIGVCPNICSLPDVEASRLLGQN